MRARARMGVCVRLCHPSLYLKPPAFVAPVASRTSDLPQGSALTAGTAMRYRHLSDAPFRVEHYFGFGGILLYPTDFECASKRTRALTHTYTQAHLSATRRRRTRSPAALMDAQLLARCVRACALPVFV